MPLELEVALAYLRSRPSRLVSSVSLLAIGGIALGVTALVVAMGLLSGYRTEIREKLLGANAEIVVYPLAPADAADVAALRRRLAGVPRVRATAPVVYQSALAASAATPDGVDAVVKGIDAADEARVSPQMSAYLPEAAEALRAPPGQPPGAAIGAELARKLGAGVGDLLAISVPDASPGVPHFVPRTGALSRHAGLPDELRRIRRGVDLLRPRGAARAVPNGRRRQRRRGQARHDAKSRGRARPDPRRGGRSVFGGGHAVDERRALLRPARSSRRRCFSSSA